MMTCTYALSATVSAPALLWTGLQGNYDFVDDQPSGLADMNIVGAGLNSGLFVTHNDNGPLSLTDGTFGFRLRLDAPGGNKNNPKYERAAYIGIDADFNDTIDVFIGVNFSGSKQELGIYAPGSGLNNSPDNTSVGALVKSYTVNSSTYSYRAVNYLTDGGTTNDLNPANGQNDYYLTVMVNFADIVSYLSEKGILITDQSPLRFVAMTSNNGNNLNADIAGISGSANAANTWSQTGAFTQAVNANGIAVSGATITIPEIRSAMMLQVGALLLLLRRNRDR
ncbi:MAG: hypothetical protein ABJQ93_14460 [Luteolibacter sp.]